MIDGRMRISCVGRDGHIRNGPVQRLVVVAVLWCCVLCVLCSGIWCVLCVVYRCTVVVWSFGRLVVWSCGAVRCGAGEDGWMRLRW